MKPSIFPDGRMTPEAAAEYLGLTVSTLATMRSRGNGPLFLKRGRIFYYQADLDTWLQEAGKASSTAQQRLKQPKQQ
ncbi:MAG: helix-turn-helix domain-containing protein [Vampirovibrionales bacterium]